MTATVLEQRSAKSGVLLSEQDMQRLRDMVSDVANFIAIYESTSHKIEQHEMATGQRLQQAEQYFEQRLQSIDERLEDFHMVLTEAGVARWRLAAEETLMEGKEHLAKVEEAAERIEQVSDAAIHDIQEAGKVLAIEEIREVSDDCARRIGEEADNVMRRLNQTSSWFHWQRIATVLITVILSAFIITSFTNDQLPWETHNQIKMERDAGQAILKAWPKLSKAEQRDIQRYA